MLSSLFQILYSHSKIICIFSLCYSGNAPETRGTAFVVYEDIFDAKNACDHLSGFNVCNRYLVVLYYQSTKVSKFCQSGALPFLYILVHQDMKVQFERSFSHNVLPVHQGNVIWLQELQCQYQHFTSLHSWGSILFHVGLDIFL